MTLLRFMLKIWDYRWLTPLCIAATIMLPIGVEIHGAPSDAWRIFCWMLSPAWTVGLFVGAYVHMKRLHVRMLERRWREANRMCPHYTPQSLDGLFLALRNEPWCQD